MEKKIKEAIIILIPTGIFGVTVGTLTGYDFISTTIAFMFGGFVGSLILKLFYKGKNGKR